MSAPSLRIHVAEAAEIRSSGGLFSGNNVYIGIKLDGRRCGESPAVKVDSHARAPWNYNTEVHCPAGAASLQFEVQRSGTFGSHYIGGCVLPVQELVHMDRQELPLFDSSSKQAGKIVVSITRVGGSIPAAAPAGGLVNRASIASSQASSLVNAPAASLDSRGPALSHQGSVTFAGGGMPGGLVNHAPMGSLTSSVNPPTASSASAAGSGGLMNQAHTTSFEQPQELGTVRPSFARAGTMGLANMASLRDDGSRPNALPRAQELLKELEGCVPGSEEQRQKLSQALDNLRHSPADDLKSSAGMDAIATCSQLIKGMFEEALEQKSDKDANGALWLAGRLPLDEDTEVTLQDQLRGRWDENKMQEAFARAEKMLTSASTDDSGLEDFMDALDLAEFHAHRVQQDKSATVQRLLRALQPALQEAARRWLSQGLLDKVENAIASVGAARVDTLGLRSVQQDLQRMRGLELLQAALLPSLGQMGFPELKKRQLRHAVMTIRTALAEDESGKARIAVRSLLLEELIPNCLEHSSESASAAIRTAVDLHLPDREVWDLTHSLYQRLPSVRKQEFYVSLSQLCLQLGRDAPSWLLTPEQAACQHTLRQALKSSDAGELQTACQKVMDTPGGNEACQEEMRQAFSRLRADFRLPGAWDVETMFTGTKLLAKTEITDRSLLQLFDELAQRTALPDVRTRDRRGGLPRTFRAVKAVQVMNAASWASYLQRRDEIRTECLRMKARSDHSHWRDNLNGELMTMSALGRRVDLLNSETPLMTEANECWLLHGSSHAAAEGITSEDFDMTRANPSGLFGAGVYFAESSSKSDEYVQGKVIDGQELFPLLLCRVCLGYIYYCDTRHPDRRQLESRCLREDWHSVLGDRKKTSGTFREFIVYDNLQAFPAYIIYYRRQF